MITLHNTPKAAISKAKLLDSAETRKHLEVMFHKACDPDVFDGISLDKRETARFIAEKLRVIRVAANASGLRTLTWMIENTFYEAYSNAQSRKSEGIDFVNVLNDLH